MIGQFFSFIKKQIPAFAFSLVGSVSMLLLRMPVAAQGNVNVEIPNVSRFNDLEDIINAAASLIQPVFLLTFLGMLLVGAVVLLTSQGDEEKIGTARGTIIAAIIGFVIAVLAPTIVNFILNLLGVDGFEL